MSLVYNASLENIKRLTVAFLISVFLILGSGCVENREKSNEEPNGGKTVTDHLEREVTIPGNPQRILALNPLMMEGLFAIGITPVGKVDEYKIREEGVALTSVGTQQNVNIEAILQLKPDLILAHMRNHGEIIGGLEETGAAVYVFNPAKLGDNPLLSSVEFLGELLDYHEQARSYTEAVNKTAELLREEIQSQSDIRSAVIIEDGDTITVAQSATSYGSIISALGIRNIVPDDLPGSSKESFVAFDIETIIAEDPDIILVMASSNDFEQNRKVIQKFKTDPKWTNLRAVKGDRIKTLPFKVHPGRSTAEEMLRITARVILSGTNQD